MKILLISANKETEPYPVAPLGIAYIAKALLAKGHEVLVEDICFCENLEATLSQRLNDFHPDFIGLSIRNIDNLTYQKSLSYLPGIKTLVNLLKRLTKVPIVVGGSGYSLFPEAILHYLELDYGIRGEGEMAFPLLVEALSQKSLLSAIPNLSYFEKGRYVSNSMKYQPFRMIPDRSFLQNQKYLENGGMGNLQTKRGCPFQCVYCTYPCIDGNILRLREPREVVDELQGMAVSHGIDYVFFVDDIFNFPTNHALVICEEIIRREIKIDWACFCTPDGMNRELAGLMKKAGCKGIEFGTDGGTGETLQQLGKQFNLEDIVHATECCRAVGLPNAHYLILGGPGETQTTLAQTFSFFDQLNPTAVIALLGLRIYPETHLYLQAVEEGLVKREQDLLDPVFYLSPEIAVDYLLQEVTQQARQRHNWVVPGLNIHSDSDMLNQLRKMGIRGPLWDLL